VEDLVQDSARIQKEMDERKTRGKPSHRDEKSPTRTAMNLSFSAINKVNLGIFASVSVKNY
jgi:hypothetical protein